MELKNRAVVVCNLIGGDEENVSDQERSILPFSHALEEKLQHSIVFHGGLVDHSYYQGLVPRGNSL